MPSKMTPEETKWAEDVCKALQLQFPASEGDPQEGAQLDQVTPKKVHFDGQSQGQVNTPEETTTESIEGNNVPVNAANLGPDEIQHGVVPDQPDEKAAQQKPHDNQKRLLYKRLKGIQTPLDNIADKKAILVDDATLPKFNKSHLRAKNLIEKSQNILFSDERPNLEKVTVYLDEAQTHLDFMQGAYRSGQALAAVALKHLKPQVDKTQQKFENIYQNRQKLARSDIDLSQFDRAYNNALENFTAMNTALNGYVVQDVKKTLTQAEADLAIFSEANKQAKIAIDAAKAELLLKVLSAEQDIMVV